MGRAGRFEFWLSFTDRASRAPLFWPVEALIEFRPAAPTVSCR